MQLSAAYNDRSQDVPSNKLFFAGLPKEVTEETFRAMMEKFPGFEAARLRHDRAGQCAAARSATAHARPLHPRHVPAHRWVGFVDFSEEPEATACKNAMAGAKLDPNNSALVTVRYSGQARRPANARPPSGWRTHPGLRPPRRTEE